MIGRTNSTAKNNTIRPDLISIICLCVTLCCCHAHAPTAQSIAQSLPRQYTGQFTWNGTLDVQHVTVTISSTHPDDRGRLVAIGSAVYVAEGTVTSVDVMWKINSRDLTFEMWEAGPTGDVPFATEGSHVGRISSDLKEINAVWTQKPSGETGTLVLRAK